jgi:hypothetical protein
VTRVSFRQLLVWCFVLSAGVMCGGSIFEHVVVTPLWAGSPPESVRQWPHGGIQGSFFAIASSLYALLSIALAVASRWMPARQRSWALCAGLSGIIVVAITVLFFLPILDKTEVSRGAGLSDDEITRLVTDFKTWNWGRWALMIGGWIAALRALSLSHLAPANTRIQAREP